MPLLMVRWAALLATMVVVGAGQGGGGGASAAGAAGTGSAGGEGGGGPVCNRVLGCKYPVGGDEEVEVVEEERVEELLAGVFQAPQETAQQLLDIAQSSQVREKLPKAGVPLGSPGPFPSLPLRLPGRYHLLPHGERPGRVGLHQLKTCFLPF